MKPEHKKLLARLVGLYDRETVAREAMTVELPKRGNRQAKGRPVLTEDEGYRWLSMLTALAIDATIDAAKQQGYAAPTEYAFGSYLNLDPNAPTYEEEEQYIKARKALERRVAIGRALLREHRNDPAFKALLQDIPAALPHLPPMEEAVKFDPSKLRKKKSRG